MKRKKAIAVILTAALITGSVFGIGVAVRKTTSGNSAVTVIQGSNINTGYWGNDTQSMNGTVSSSATQNVYLNSGDTVRSVNVKAGDTVKAGDVLLKYDPAKAELAFKGEQISYDEIQLKIKVAQQNLNTLSKIKPVADSAPDSGGTDIDNGGDGGDNGDIDDGGYDNGGDIDDGGYDDGGGDNGGDIDDGGDDNGGNTDSGTDSGKTDSDTDSGKTDSDTDSGDTKNDYSKALKSISGLAGAYNAQPGYKDKDTLGTKENPYRFLINDNTVIRVSFLKELASKGGANGTESGNTSSDSSAESSGSTSGSTSESSGSSSESSGSQSDGSRTSSGISSESTSSDSSGKKADSSSDQTSSGTSSEKTDSGKNHCYVVFEVREGDSVRGKLTNAWRIDAADIEAVATDSESDPSSDKTGSDTSSDSKPTGSDSSSESSSSGKSDSGSSTSGKTGSESSTPGESSGSSASGKTGSEGSASGKSSGSGSTGGSSGVSSGSGSAGSGSSGSVSSGTEAGSEPAEGSTGTAAESSLESLPASLVLLKSGAVRLMSTADSSDGSSDASGDSSSDSDNSSSLAAIGVISADTQYTKDELAQAIQEQKDTLRDEQLNLKEEDIKLRAAQKAVEAGTVVAKMDGVVKSVGDLSNPPKDGSAFITVTGGSGTYIKSAVSETYLDSLHEGDTVTVMSWNSGTTATAVVKDISTYPDTTGQYAQSNANVSYYPFTAVVEGDANFSADDYLNVTLDSVGAADQNGFYLMKAFVRTDDSGQKYVYKEGSDGKLKKQVITVGTVTSDGYEVKSGVTEDDWIAFPYGKNVKDGAKVKEGSIEDMYNS